MGFSDNLAFSGPYIMLINKYDLNNDRVKGG